MRNIKHCATSAWRKGQPRWERVQGLSWPPVQANPGESFQLWWQRHILQLQNMIPMEQSHRKAPKSAETKTSARGATIVRSVCQVLPGFCLTLPFRDEIFHPWVFFFPSLSESSQGTGSTGAGMSKCLEVCWGMVPFMGAANELRMDGKLSGSELTFSSCISRSNERKWLCLACIKKIKNKSLQRKAVTLPACGMGTWSVAFSSPQEDLQKFG